MSIFLLVWVSGCATVGTIQEAPRAGVEVYRIGEVTVRLYDDERELMADVGRLLKIHSLENLLPNAVMTGYFHR